MKNKTHNINIVTQNAGGRNHSFEPRQAMKTYPGTFPINPDGNLMTESQRASEMSTSAPVKKPYIGGK